jgi:hypothetical protein
MRAAAAKRLRVLVTLVLLHAAVVGCAGIPLGVVLAPVGANHRPGDYLEIELRNPSSRTIHPELCRLELQRRCKERWPKVPNRDLDERVCLGYAEPLRPGATTRTRLRLDSATPAGSYRVATTVEVAGQTYPLHSSTFSVISSGPPLPRDNCDG